MAANKISLQSLAGDGIDADDVTAGQLAAVPEPLMKSLANCAIEVS